MNRLYRIIYTSIRLPKTTEWSQNGRKHIISNPYVYVHIDLFFFFSLDSSCRRTNIYLICLCIPNPFFVLFCSAFHGSEYYCGTKKKKIFRLFASPLGSCLLGTYEWVHVLVSHIAWMPLIFFGNPLPNQLPNLDVLLIFCVRAVGISPYFEPYKYY